MSSLLPRRILPALSWRRGFPPRGREIEGKEAKGVSRQEVAQGPAPHVRGSEKDGAWKHSPVPHRGCGRDIQLEGEDILILIHLSWGELDAVEKVRLYAHHVNEEDEGALYEELTRNL